ncbi:MAG: FAD-dependent oxidoreductase [Bdellovibrionales bacterium]|nr:FAD-dependent oxidoreductase [Bdellovibrionales bacterium]
MKPRALPMILYFTAIVLSASPGNALPTQNRNSKIAIVGGGVSGLTAAYQLVKLGYKEITIFEAAGQVGGKVSTFYHPETKAPYEIGAIIQSDSFKNIYAIAKDIGYADRPDVWLKPYPGTAVVSDAAGHQISSFLRYHSQLGAKGRRSFLNEAMAAPGFANLISPMGILNRSGAFDHGFERLLADTSPSGERLLRSLYEPMDRFMQNAPIGFGGLPVNISALTGRYSLFFNMTGYGFTSEVPALYHLKFLKMVTRVAAEQITGRSTGLLNSRFGYQKFFIFLADWLKQNGVRIQLGHRVLDVVRGERFHLLKHQKGVESPQSDVYDLSIVATAADVAQRFLHDTTPDEKEMLTRVKYYNFVTSIFEVSDTSGLRKQATTFVEDYAVNASVAIPRGHVIGLYNNDGSNVFTAYQFAPANASDADLNQILVEDVKKLGGQVKKILVTKQWKNYFPHYSSETLKSERGNFLRRVTSVQGKRNTLFIMANLDFESTEHLAGFSRELVQKYFK